MDLSSLPSDLLGRTLRRLPTAGLCVGLTRGGVRHVQALRGAGGPPATDALFPLVTLTQVFTGALLAVQVARGELRLDTPLAEVIPRPLLPDEAAGRLTLEQLATHTAGLPQLPPNLTAAKPEDPLGGYTALHFGEFLRSFRPSHPPPRPCAESLLGLGVLGHALGRRAGLNFGHALRDLLCKPLGLADTTLRPDDAQQPRVLAGHDAHGRPMSPWTFPSLPGAGALHSTAADLLSFLEVNLGRGPAELVQALQLTHAPRARDGKRGVGLGWLVSRGAAGPVLWRSASLGGFSGFLGFVPAADAGVVLLVDTELGRSRLDALLRRAPLEREGHALLARLAQRG